MGLKDFLLRNAPGHWAKTRNIGRRSTRASLSRASLDLVRIEAQTNELALKERIRINDSQRVKIAIISEKSTFRITWDVVCIMAAWYTFFQEPLFIAFELEEWYHIYPSFAVLETFLDLYHVFTTALNFRTSYYIESTREEVRDADKIAYRYFTSWFAYDICSSVPVSWFIDNTQTYVIVLRLIKVLRVYSTFGSAIYKNISKAIASKTGPVVLRVLKLFMVLIMLQHLMGCLIWYMCIKYPIRMRWAELEHMHEDKVWNQYIASYHLALLLTIRRKTNPTTPFEALVSVLFWMVGISIYVAIIGECNSSMSEISN